MKAGTTRPLVAVLASTALLALARRRYLHFGASMEAAAAALPGDELVQDSNITATRAISVSAPASAVWPWIAQLGQGRGGFYSYDRLENLVGCDIHSAESVIAEWQTVGVGDDVKLHPEVSLKVALLDPGTSLVLRGGIPMGPVAPPYDFSWAFTLHEQHDGSTRLIVRERYRYTRWWSRLLVEPVQVVSFVMSRRMLLGIKQRAESMA